MRINWLRTGAACLEIILLCGIANAQTSVQTAHDLSGTWQGTMPDGKRHRLLLKITKQGAGWGGIEYDLDSMQPSQGRNTTQMSLAGAEVRFAIAPLDGTFLGRMSDDGASFAGMWTQAGQAIPLSFARATGDAEWKIPASPSQMAKDADPDWEVVTVRPTDPSVNSATIRMDGRQFMMTNRTVETLLLVGFGVHKKQLANAPGWIATEHWDIKGIPDVPGQPSIKQMQTLARKVLAERFGLTTHNEQREIEAYALTVAKGGVKMSPSAADPEGIFDENDNENGGILTMRTANISMRELALIMKFYMDRPIVDQTGLTGRYDFQLKWTMDDARVAPESNAPPGIFTAIQDQIGLRLTPVKAKTDVLVLDTVERPSEN